MLRRSILFLVATTAFLAFGLLYYWLRYSSDGSAPDSRGLDPQVALVASGEAAFVAVAPMPRLKDGRGQGEYLIGKWKRNLQQSRPRIPDGADYYVTYHDGGRVDLSCTGCGLNPVQAGRYKIIGDLLRLDIESGADGVPIRINTIVHINDNVLILQDSYGQHAVYNHVE